MCVCVCVCRGDAEGQRECWYTVGEERMVGMVCKNVSSGGYCTSLKEESEMRKGEKDGIRERG